jgi:hypothetical protein
MTNSYLKKMAIIQLIVSLLCVGGGVAFMLLEMAGFIGCFLFSILTGALAIEKFNILKKRKIAERSFS